jgi:hypothetical protein
MAPRLGREPSRVARCLDLEGLDAAVRIARDRRRKQFDPALVGTFCDIAGDVLSSLTEEHDALVTVASCLPVAGLEATTSGTKRPPIAMSAQVTSG